MIEVSSDMKVSNRRVYAAMDFLGEIGGFYSSVNAACLLLIALLSPWNYEKYLVKKLYRRSKPDTTSVETPRTIGSDSKSLLERAMSVKNRRMPIIAHAHNAIREVMQFALRGCWRYSKEDIYFKKARTRLNTELDVKQVIRTINFLKAAVKLFTSKRERRLLRIQANRTAVTVTQ